MPIQDITAENFKNQETMAQTRDEAQDFFDHLSLPEAYKFSLELDKKLQELAPKQNLAPQAYEWYQHILTKLQFLSLSYWDDDTILYLIKNNLADILGTSLVIGELLTGKFYLEPDFVWPNFEDQMLQTLRENSQPVGGYYLKIKDEPSPRPPLIKYWLIDYDRTIGREKHTNLERAHYFASSFNYKNIGPEDKIKIQQLLEFYDGLKPLPMTQGEELSFSPDQDHPLVAMPRQKGAESFGQEEKHQETTFRPSMPTGPIPFATPISSPDTPARPAAPAPRPPMSVPQPQRPMPTPQPKPVFPPAQRPTPAPLTSRPASPPPSLPTQSPAKDNYREPVSEKDTAGPGITQKPAPRLNGNTINLREFGNNNQN